MISYFSYKASNSIFPRSIRSCNLYPMDPDSIPMDLADYYDHDEREINRMMHSSGPERRYMADQANSSRGREKKEGKDDEGKR